MMLASWSSRVTTISSPGWKVRARERLMWKVRVVMLGPKTTSSASQPRRSATAWWASWITWSVRRLVSKAPWVLALRRVR